MNLISIYDHMVEFGEVNSNSEFTPAELTKVLRNFLGTADLKVALRRDDNVHHDQIVINGYYDPSEDEDNFASIFLFANFNPKQTSLSMKNLDWEKLCVDFIECAGHEIIHQSQYRARNFDISAICFVSGQQDPIKRVEQEYLGSADEVEAYGFSIAVDAFLRFRTKRLTAAQVSQSPIYRMYLDSFGIQHPVVKQLLIFSCKYYIQLTGGSNA